MTLYEFKLDFELHSKLLTGEASENEKLAFNEWLDLDANNRLFWNHIQDEFLLQCAAIAGVESDVNKGWSSVERKIYSSGAKKSLSKRFVSKSHIYTYASLAALFALVLLFSYNLYFNSSSDSVLVTTMQMQQVDIALEDGSLVTVNGSSQFSHPTVFSNTERAVELKGEAFFVVSKDAKKSFVINTDNLVVKVLGTQFNVKDYGVTGSIKHVAVVEGRVEVRSKTDLESVIIISKGEEVLLDSQSGKLVKSLSKSRNFIAWKTKELSFEKNSLKEVFATLSDVYQVEFKVDNESVLNRRLTAEFNQKDINFVMKVISSTFNFSYTIDDELVVIK